VEGAVTRRRNLAGKESNPYLQSHMNLPFERAVAPSLSN
jgi:hypothetical protein